MNTTQSSQITSKPMDTPNPVGVPEHSSKKSAKNKGHSSLQKTIDHLEVFAKSIANNTPIDHRILQTTWNPLVDCVKNDEYKLALQTLKGYSSTFYSHSLRVAIFMCVFAKALNLSKPETILLASGGYMLDLGMTLLPLSLLNKPEVFSNEDLQLVQKHVDYSVEILETIEGTDPLVFEITKLHHERLDGSGYPLGLQSWQINDVGRMAAIADIFAALTDKRPHRPALDTHTAFIKMEDMGKALDQDLLRQFRDVLES